MATEDPLAENRVKVKEIEKEIKKQFAETVALQSPLIWMT